MNCPMCGAPLGDNDAECPKCYTKRSEMGPAYNNNNNGYGGGYGNNYNTGYGGQNSGYSNNSYGNNSYNTGYNQNYGNTSNYNGLGTGSSLSRANYGSGSGSRIAAIILIIILAFAAVFWIFIRPSMFKKFDMGTFTVELPMDCREDSTGLGSSLNGLGEAKGFTNDDLGFAYARLNLGNEAAMQQLRDQKDNLIDMLDTVYSSQKGYTKISSTLDTLEFRYYQGGTEVFCRMKILFEGNDMYAVICVCNASDQTKISPKFSRIMNSIKFK